MPRINHHPRESRYNEALRKTSLLSRALHQATFDAQLRYPGWRGRLMSIPYVIRAYGKTVASLFREDMRRTP